MAATCQLSKPWHVMTGKNVDLVFLQELATGSAWKVSLHNEPGRISWEPAWRIAMTKEEAVECGTDRHVIDDWVPESADKLA